MTNINIAFENKDNCEKWKINNMANASRNKMHKLIHCVNNMEIHLLKKSDWTLMWYADPWSRFESVVFLSEHSWAEMWNDEFILPSNVVES